MSNTEQEGAEAAVVLHREDDPTVVSRVLIYQYTFTIEGWLAYRDHSSSE